METNRFFKTVKKGCFVKVEETKRAICNFGQRQVSSPPKQLRPLNRITFNCSRINQFWRDRTLELCSVVFEIPKLWLSFYTKRVWFMCLKVHLLVRIPSQDDLRGVKRLTRACRQGERERLSEENKRSNPSASGLLTHTLKQCLSCCCT
ncbi:hypothetical protein L798_07632 [Zootermopsis nevadensis]|uniref:Uncharacterized protein n=1 Tax=Zootermopsis nevadensis TaxID=136037 RepID=A0A067RTT4_ZOONE|nr:hypothetical protein L798_07632 [Zootermopsis nevadensis]